MSSGNNLPPSFSDCKVKEEAKADINRIAECFYYDVKDRLAQSSKQRFDRRVGETYDDLEEQCVQLAEGMGLHLLDSGISRISFAVTPDPQPSTPDPDGPTSFEQCVFKFARYGKRGNADGKNQMDEEISNYRNLPDSLTEPSGNKPPVFNPIQDVDESEHLWLTQPFCAPPGDNAEVQRRLRDNGYEASDLHADNVGTYKTLPESAIIDYGLSVDRINAARPGRVQNDMEAQLRRYGATDITNVPDRQQGGGEIQWRPDMDHPGELPPSQESYAMFTPMGDIAYMDVFFPGFPETRIPDAEMDRLVDEVADRADDVGIVTSGRVDTSGTDFIAANIEVDVTGRDLAPSIAAEVYANISDAYDAVFNEYANPFGNIHPPGTTVQPANPKERRYADLLERMGMEQIGFPGRNEPDIVFLSPTTTPFREDRKVSQIWLSGVDKTAERIEYIPSELYIDTSGFAHRVEQDTITPLMREVAQSIEDEYPDARVDDRATYPDHPQTDTPTVNTEYAVTKRGRTGFSAREAEEILDSLRVVHHDKFRSLDDRFSR